MEKKIQILLISFFFFLNQSFSQTPVANFSASALSGCAPLQVNFTNTSTNSNNYQWTFGDGNSSTVQNPSHIFATSGIFNVKLIAHNSSGVTDSFVTTITVHPKPAASFQVSSNAACVNNNQFSFNNTSTGANAYLWDFGDGVTSTAQNPVHTYNLAGTYSIKLIATNNSGCSGIIEKINHITIHPKPDADFTVNINYACSTSQSFVFAPQQINLTYLWNFGDGNISTVNSPSHNYFSPGNYSVQLNAIDNNGCKDSILKNNFVTVGSNISASISADKTSGCPPLTVNLTANTPGMDSTYWNFGNGNQTTASNTFSNPGIYNISVTQIDSNGCPHVTQFNNYITVHIPPQASFIINDTAGCAPFTVTFSNNSTNMAWCYWNFGDGNGSTNINPTHVFNSNGSFLVSLSVYSANGCGSNFIHPTEIEVSSPLASFSSNTSTGCAPLTVNFTNQSSNAVQYFWDFGDGTTSTAANPTKTYNQAGNYTITLAIQSSNGCSDTIVYSNYIKVLNPYAGYTPPPIKTGCAPFTVSFVDHTGGNSNVLWNFGDGSTSVATHPTHVYTTAGIYTVSLTTQTVNGCTFDIPNYQTIEVKGAEANFSVNYTSCPPYIASFIDSSVNAVSWLWNFGDGNTSTQQNPTHTYGGYGTYNVSLTITTTDGCSHTKLVVNAVAFEQLSANFTWSAQNSGFPMTIDFIANSTGATSWLWDFGDGGTSNLENPTYTYQLPGQYTVTLTVSNGNCSITYVMSNTTFGSGAGGMDPGPGPGPAQQAVDGCAPFTVQFNDPTINSVNWLWNFGDGNTSIIQNPVHSYFSPGIYNIILFATKSSGTVDTIYMNGIVNVSGPVASFTVAQSTNCQSTVVTTTDQSTNAVQWNWDFGDGNSASVQNPTHIYQSTLNNYTINLTATDSLGCTNQMYQNINSGNSQAIFADKYSICKGDTVFFQTNLSGYSFYIWDFGDGNISFSQQPYHIYNNHGNYQVTLVVYSSSGCTFNHYLPLNINVNGPVADFTTMDEPNGCNEITVNFVNLSANSTDYLWDLGEGTITTYVAPIWHPYGPGIFDVTLIAMNNGCSDTLTKTQFVNVKKLEAHFSVNQLDICQSSTVQFIDSSINAISWNWDFGDGTTSQLQNPAHTYNSPLNQDITLTVSDSSGCTSIYTHPPLIFISGSFQASVNTGCAPLTVNFTSNVQNAASVQWLFGDGSTSTLLNPVHTYQNAGSYDVQLILISAGGCTDTITEKALIGVSSPTAAFSHIISSNCIPAVVDFTNSSQNAVSWFWDFGDGTYSSAENPSKIYNTPGHFDVTLVVTNSNGCTDTIVMPSLISVSGPVTNFTINTNTICFPVEATFTDLSLNAVNWIWSFGDGTSDSIQNPVHVFSDTGIFSVTLIATDTAGCSAVYTLPSSVEVRPTAVAGFMTSDTLGCTPHYSSFVNSSQNANIFSWSFGDGNISVAPQPVHSYYQSGNFDVQLIATNQYGCADTLILNQLINVTETPVAEFITNVITGCSPLTVQFTDQSGNLQNTTWLWDLGNGNISTLQNPQEVFVNPGGYTVTLTVTNNGICSSTVIKPSLIIVNDFIPPAESPIFSVSVKSNSEVEITYGYVIDLDLLSYNVYRKDLATGNFNLINTQYNINSTSFSWDTTIVDNNVSTTSNVYTYKIQTIDICGNAIPLENLPEYNTINVLASPQANGIKVTWNEYGGCSVENYNIYRNKINQTPQLIATVPSTTLEYFDNEVLCPDDFSYKIEATNLCGLNYISLSDTSIAYLPNLIAEQKVEIVRSTVIDDQTVLTEWTEPLIAPDKVLNYNIYRSENNSNYQLIATLPAQATNFVDMNTEVDLSRYIYSVEVINVCNLSGLPSNIGNSILLKAAGENNRMILNWNGYVGWDSGVNNYKIERMDETGNWKEIGNVDGETRNFID